MASSRDRVRRDASTACVVSGPRRLDGVRRDAVDGVRRDAVERRPRGSRLEGTSVEGTSAPRESAAPPSTAALDAVEAARARESAPHMRHHVTSRENHPRKTQAHFERRPQDDHGGV